MQTNKKISKVPRVGEIVLTLFSSMFRGLCCVCSPPSNGTYRRLLFGIERSV